MTVSLGHNNLQSTRVSFSVIQIQTCDLKCGNTTWSFMKGRGGGGWYLIGQCADDLENEVLEKFSLEMACELIGETQQEEGIEVIRQEAE